MAAIFAVPTIPASLAVSLITPLVGAFGTTGKAMLGGRLQNRLAGYWLVMSISFALVVLTAPLYWCAARDVDRRAHGEALQDQPLLRPEDTAEKSSRRPRRASSDH